VICSVGLEQDEEGREKAALGKDRATMEEVKGIGSALELRQRVETCSRRWQGGQRQAVEQSASAAPEEEDKGDFPRDLFAKLKKHRDPTVN
jgi:hypothetical protein